jgi:hypothetical protein
VVVAAIVRPTAAWAKRLKRMSKGEQPLGPETAR